VPLIVDNTVATPYLCRTFEHGADIIIHSPTKHIGGHGTSIGGVIIDSDKFDWVKNKARFAVLNELDPSYHRVVYTEAFGPVAYIGRCRVVNIGDAKSLACHPASTTQRQLNSDELASAYVSEDLVRISVGIEHINDIIGDVEQALSTVG